MRWMFAFLLVSCVASAEIDSLPDAPPVEDPRAASYACPSAPEWLPLGVLWWKTSRAQGPFVWASDGQSIAGVELVYEEKWPWINITGETQKRRFCHRLFTQPLGGSKTFVDAKPMPYAVHALFYMQPAGYFVVNAADYAGYSVVQRVAPGGARKLLAQRADGCSTAEVFPSPDGTRLASLLVEPYDCTLFDESSAHRVSVSMLDSAGNPVNGLRHAVDQHGWTMPVWNADGFVVLSASEAYAWDDDGAPPVAVERPVCTMPPTTSSIVDADGRQLDIVDGQIGVATMAPDRAYGCGL